MTKAAQWQEIYEYGLVPAIFGPWSTKTVALAVPNEGDYVLDVACGTGVVTRLAAQYIGTHGNVIGLDLNPGMVEVARSLPVPTDTSIDWQVGDALMLPFPNATFHVVFCQGGLQFVPDRLTALREMHRVLRPEGRLALMVCQHIQYCPGFAILVDKLTSHVGWQAATLLRMPFSLGDMEELRSLMVKAGFQDVIIRPEVKMIRFPSPAKFVQSLITGSSIADQVDESTMAKLITEASLELQPFVKNDELSFPMGVHFAVAHTRD
ncbi:MAG TPA: methyltransferase domain-containing protein [Ktedonobacteraceae bacterium]|jgi:ubiquinone/menaquinone biosynthesis C-methylase UbiE